MYMKFFEVLKMLYKCYSFSLSLFKFFCYFLKRSAQMYSQTTIFCTVDESKWTFGLHVLPPSQLLLILDFWVLQQVKVCHSNIQSRPPKALHNPLFALLGYCNQMMIWCEDEINLKFEWALGKVCAFLMSTWASPWSVRPWFVVMSEWFTFSWKY